MLRHLITRAIKASVFAPPRCIYTPVQTILPIDGKLFSTRVQRERPPPITITENAATRIKELLSNKDGSLGIIIGVKRRGCNGYSYTMNYATAADVEEKRDAKDAYESVHTRGVSVYVDPKALFSIVGTEMDFEETALASEFTFNNPNSKGSCGCGESFNV